MSPIGQRPARAPRAIASALAAVAVAAVAATATPVAASEPVRAPLTIVAIGDSITAGTTRSGRPGGGPNDARRDPLGGYPGRLARELGAAAVVKNRGAGGATTRFWLDAPSSEPAHVRAFATALWPDFRPRDEPARGENLLAWVLASERPDVVLLLIGVNDLAERRSPAPDPDAIADRIARLVDEARASGARVLVATLLPNRRDPAAAIAEVNRRLCDREPDCVRLGERFAAAGGDALLGDEVHPGEEGHAVVARVFADELRARAIVEIPPERAAPATPQGGGADAAPGSPAPRPAAPSSAASGGATPD